VDARDNVYFALALFLFKKFRYQLSIPFQSFHLISLCTPSGKTALHLSSWDGHREVCELLISCGAEVDATEERYVALPLFIF
jgi:hypothetical protein